MIASDRRLTDSTKVEIQCACHKVALSATSNMATGRSTTSYIRKVVIMHRITWWWWVECISMPICQVLTQLRLAPGKSALSLLTTVAASTTNSQARASAYATIPNGWHRVTLRIGRPAEHPPNWWCRQWCLRPCKLLATVDQWWLHLLSIPWAPAWHPSDHLPHRYSLPWATLVELWHLQQPSKIWAFMRRQSARIKPKSSF